jgi:hypothetical protein
MPPYTVVFYDNHLISCGPVGARTPVSGFDSRLQHELYYHRRHRHYHHRHHLKDSRTFYISTIQPVCVLIFFEVSAGCVRVRH